MPPGNALKAAPYALKFKFRGGGLFSTAQGGEGLEGGARRVLRPPPALISMPILPILLHWAGLNKNDKFERRRPSCPPKPGLKLD